MLPICEGVNSSHRMLNMFKIKCRNSSDLKQVSLILERREFTSKCRDLESFCPGRLEETTGTSSYGVVDLKSKNLSLNEATDMAQN